MATPPDPASATNRLRARRIALDTHDQPVIITSRECPVCRSEGFSAHARVRLTAGGHQVIATLYQLDSELLAPGEAALSEAAWERLGIQEGDLVALSHPRPLESLSRVRGRIHGLRLERDDLHRIITDVAAGRYADVHLAMLLTAIAARPMDDEELISLTEAMIEAGERLEWSRDVIADKHCVGGLPGNRTTPLVVAICAAAGLCIPKTSSRAITSPAGTADTMETMAPVDLDIPAMRRVVEAEGGCVVWGGAVRLSPVDDILIRVARLMDLDAEGQLVASVLSKKAAAGATHLLLDLPVGDTAKVRTPEAGAGLGQRLAAVAAAFGLRTRILLTDGRQPVGRGIGPALEARDVLAVLQGAGDAPADLRRRAVELAGGLLELAGAVEPGHGQDSARALLEDGAAWAKFQAICQAQGGMREPPRAARQFEIAAAHGGRVVEFDNRRLGRVAKLAGAPGAPAAGVELLVHLDDEVERGQPLYVIHAESAGELAYARDYAAGNGAIIRISGQPEDH